MRVFTTLLIVRKNIQSSRQSSKPRAVSTHTGGPSKTKKMTSRLKYAPEEEEDGGGVEIQPTAPQLKVRVQRVDPY